MKTCNANSVMQVINSKWIDMHCEDYGIGLANDIFFDSDPKGNGNPNIPWYRLKFYKHFAKIVSGCKLLAEDKLIFHYDDFCNTEDFVNAIVDFNKYYFNSFELTRK